ncbi:MAG TPA: ShlB/FhaC/HecB family hemolysin secretion/activation protein [Acetobacteraceae bacterium]|nr:ShlB/FhaC/HecB family hemolysin secretion/activation protein [Acetobacteraceae bacterium]
MGTVPARHGRCGLRRGLAIAVLCLGALPAHAQSVPPALLNQVPQVSPLPHILPMPKPRLGGSLPNFRPLTPEAAVPNARVPVRSVAVIGATAFPRARLDEVTARLTGPAVPLARIEAARRGLVSLYRRHGYVLTAVSAEIDAAGDLRFIVTEGRIVSVKLSHNIGPAGTLVLRFLDHLTHERPVREASLEHWLLLAERIPGLDVSAVLQPDAATPGSLTLVADLRRRPVSGLLTADNRAFGETGPAEGLAVMDVNSLSQFGDQTEFSLFHTSADTNNFGQATESFFIGSSGLRASLYAGAGRAQPGGILREIGYRSHLDVFGASLSYLLALRRGESLGAALHLDGTENRIDTATSVIGGLSGSSRDSVRALRGELKEAFADDALGGDRTALSTASLELSKGLHCLGASANGRDDAGRLGERIDFWKLDAALARTQTLFSPWNGASIAVRGEAGGQFTTDILPPSEEFYLGGSRFTRGYYSGEVTGDRALYASAELQLDTDIAFGLLGRHFRLGTQFYGFYDWGETWQNRHIIGERPNDHRLESAGGGIRIGLTRRLEFDVEALHRFATRLVPLGSGVAPLAGMAIYWGVLARY